MAVKTRRARPRSRQVDAIERGDIFFFYRPKVDVAKVADRGDVQRFYMLLAPDRARGRRTYRLFVVGRKTLPEVAAGRGAHPKQRNWAINVNTTTKVEDIRSELGAFEYETKTRGTREVPAAHPLGEGRYALLRHGSHTEIAYALELPARPGPAQREFEIHEQASLLIAVKNPDTKVPGAPGVTEAPELPAKLRAKFGDRRWIDVDDPGLLDHEHVQLLLLGAHAQDVREELGLELDEEQESAQTAAICKVLKLECGRRAVRSPLFEGEFPQAEMIEAGEAVEKLPPEKAPGRGGRKGGRAAATRAPSASAITKLLGGIEFPASKRALLAHARRHRDRLTRADPAIDTIRDLPARHYRSMRDVAKAIGEVR